MSIFSNRKKKVSFTTLVMTGLITMLLLASVVNYTITSRMVSLSTEELEQDLAIQEIGKFGKATKYTKSSIPQVIWQTAKSHNPPSAAQKIIQTWDELNPDWTRNLLDDEELMLFMSSNFNSTVVDAFKALPLPVMRADFFRLAVMYYEGGIYADVDVECKLPISTWSKGAIDECGVVVGMENDAHICNWGFASRKSHPLFKTAIELSLSRFVNTKIDTSNEHFVHHTTGPRLLTHAMKHLSREAGCVLPSSDSNEAKELYDSCRKVLKEKYGVCLYDRSTQEKWFQNHYSSQQEHLQSEDWVTSWIQQRDETIIQSRKIN